MGYAFCSAEYPGGVAVILINLDETHTAEAFVSLTGRREDYALSPDWPDDETPPRFKGTSRRMRLNGRLLAVGSSGQLPDLRPKGISGSGNSTKLFAVPPLQFM